MPRLSASSHVRPNFLANSSWCSGHATAAVVSGSRQRQSSEEVIRGEPAAISSDQRRSEATRGARHLLGFGRVEVDGLGERGFVGDCTAAREEWRGVSASARDRQAGREQLGACCRVLPHAHPHATSDAPHHTAHVPRLHAHAAACKKARRAASTPKTPPRAAHADYHPPSTTLQAPHSKHHTPSTTLQAPPSKPRHARRRRGLGHHSLA